VDPGCGQDVRLDQLVERHQRVRGSPDLIG
jgi:hypothetical protein